MLARREGAVMKKKKESERNSEGERDREAKRDEHPRLLLLKTHSSNFPSIPFSSLLPLGRTLSAFLSSSFPLSFLLMFKKDVFLSSLFLRTSPFSFPIPPFFLFSVQHPSSLPSHSALPPSPQPTPPPVLVFFPLADRERRNREKGG